MEILVTGGAGSVDGVVAANKSLLHSDAADGEHTHAGIEKAAELLDYGPTQTICEGVEEFVEWYQANQDWDEPLVPSS